MADPNAPQVNVPVATPTIGAIIGGIAGMAIATKVPDPIAQNAIMGAVAGFVTWLFHFAHSKIGTPE